MQGDVHMNRLMKKQSTGNTEKSGCSFCYKIPNLCYKITIIYPVGYISVITNVNTIFWI